jgi:hypothetical protein
MNRSNAAIRDNHTAAEGNEAIRAHAANRVFGRPNTDVDRDGEEIYAGGVTIFHLSGEQVSSLRDATGLSRPGEVGHVYPIGSDSSCLGEHPKGIVLTIADAARLGIEIEE